MKIDENIYKLLKAASNITNGAYNIYLKDSEIIEGYVETETLLTIIDDLIWEVNHREEELQELREDIASNYVPVSISTQVDISDKDFI